MRHLLRATALALLLAAPAARAQKVGYVDMQRALNETEEGKAAQASLKKDFDEKQKQLDAKRIEFEKLQADLQKQAVVMTEQAKVEKAAELEKRAREVTQLYQQHQAELSKRDRELTKGIGDRLERLVAEIAEADGFAIIVSAQAVAYGQASLDLTNELIRKYNARYPAGGAAKKADAPAPAKPAAPAPAPAKK
jgi:outer membrane protein